MDLSVNLAPENKHGLILSNPVMVASGVFGYGTDYDSVVDVQMLGAIVSKGITLKPRKGNPQPRLFETSSGILNSIGLENIGLEELVQEKAPFWARWQVPVVVNIAGEEIRDYGEIAKRLDGVKGISAIEVNISCPNVGAGGIEFGVNPEMASEVTLAVKESTSLPVIVKLTPNVNDITVIARAAVDSGADALCIANTYKGMAIDINKREPVFNNIVAGLSGPAIKPLSLYSVYKVSQNVDVPVLGCGGISTASDALEYLMAGATAVQVGTAVFSDPQTPVNILKGIKEFMEQQGIKKIGEIIGIAKN